MGVCFSVGSKSKGLSYSESRNFLLCWHADISSDLEFKMSFLVAGDECPRRGIVIPPASLSSSSLLSSLSLA